MVVGGLSDMWHDLVMCGHIHFNKTEETSQKDDYSVSRWYKLLSCIVA